MKIPRWHMTNKGKLWRLYRTPGLKKIHSMGSFCAGCFVYPKTLNCHPAGILVDSIAMPGLCTDAGPTKMPSAWQHEVFD
ncbi:MAG: hypothetical protein ACREOO_10000 [bacterium]